MIFTISKKILIHSNLQKFSQRSYFSARSSEIRHIYNHFQSFWASRGPFVLGAFQGPGSLMGSPRAPVSIIIFTATLTPGLVQPQVQLGKFADFWICQSYSAKTKADGDGARENVKKTVNVFAS